MSNDKPNGKVTDIEFQMMLGEMERTLPYIIETHKNDAKILFQRYQSLQNEGFKPEEALEIIKARGQSM